MTEDSDGQHQTIEDQGMTALFRHKIPLEAAEVLATSLRTSIPRKLIATPPNF